LTSYIQNETIVYYWSALLFFPIKYITLSCFSKFILPIVF